MSDEGASPPQVVDQGPDCLRRQLRFHFNNREETLTKLSFIARRVPPGKYQRDLSSAIVYWEFESWERLEITCCAVLVRSDHRYQLTDFGRMIEDQTGFEGALLRFIIVITPNAIEETIEDWYALASAAENDQADIA